MARIILRDGRVAELRKPQNTPAERQRLRNLFRGASADSLYFRFFHVVSELQDSELDRMLSLGGSNNYSLVADAGDNLLAIGNYVLISPDSAEVAFFVDDQLQGKGLGTLLLEHLAQHAWITGIKRFEAYVLRDNHRMIQVFRNSGFEISQEWDEGTLHLVLPISMTERTRALQDVRSKLATAASLLPFFEPKTVAVVGASRDTHRLGHLLLRHVIDGGYRGTVFPVNPSARSVASVKAYASVKQIPDPIDLALIVVPAPHVLPVIDDCIKSRVKAVLIASSGFADAGIEGQILQDQIARRLRQAGIRLLGPSCLGLVNNDPSLQLNASFAPRLPLYGSTAIASHSGALGIAILEYAHRIQLGVSSFASMGNKADVSGNDLLQYWEDDPHTDMIMLYLESFGNPRKFSRIARRITRHKPILAVKSARSEDAPVDALFRQTGIIRADTLEELFDVAALLSSQPFPRGRRVAVVTNTTAAAVITVDTLRSTGLQLARDPIDLGYEALADGYRSAVPEALNDPDIDAVIVLFVPVGLSETNSVSHALREALAEYHSQVAPDDRKPVVANFLMTDDRIIQYIETASTRVPVFRFPESAVRALARVARYAEYRREPLGRLPDVPGFNPDSCRSIAAQGLGGPWLDRSSIGMLLEHAGIPWSAPAPHSEGLDRISLTVSHDSLFGPLLTVRTRPSEDVDEVSKAPREFIRLIPLTDLDARHVASSLAKSLYRTWADKSTDIFTELLLRFSLLADAVPEIAFLEWKTSIKGDTWWHRADVKVRVEHPSEVPAPAHE